MLRSVPAPAKPFEAYRALLEPALYEEVLRLAKTLRGARVLHVNSAARGGGVAVLLQSTVPLLKDLGLRAEWNVVVPSDPAFFEVTKKIHNGLQGGSRTLSRKEWALYESVNRLLARAIDPRAWDVIVVHDPQPLPVRSFVAEPGGARWVWRCHIESSKPNPAYRDGLVPFLDPYDAAVFTLPDYIIQGCQPRHLAIAPGIDAFAPKNRPLTPAEARSRLRAYGVNPDRPLVAQVSRFDPWKDPVGVVKAWRLARRDVAGLQLALIGQAAEDDPEAERVLRKVRAATRDEPDVFVVANRASDKDVRAFLQTSVAVLQKSIREGFGLTVSEALWAGTPVIGGEAGGIPLQVEHGKTGYLVNTPQEAARWIVRLAQSPDRAHAMGRAGREQVRKRFLLPRMIRDDLRLWADLLGVNAAGPGRDGRRRRAPPSAVVTEPVSSEAPKRDRVP